MTKSVYFERISTGEYSVETEVETRWNFMVYALVYRALKKFEPSSKQWNIFRFN